MKQVSILVIALIGVSFMCCCVGTGAACSLGFSPMLDKRAADISKMPTTPDVKVGAKAALTGTLANNAVITNDPDLGDIAGYQLVAYRVETYSTHTTGSGSSRRTSGSWSSSRTVMNTLTMNVKQTAVTFYAGSSFALNGTLRTFPENGSTSDNAKRLRGFQNGDLVTIVAKRMANGQFMADELYGGTRDQLVSNTRTLAALLRYAGYILLAVGGGIGVVLLIGLVILLKNKSASPVNQVG